jgi:hypothetical protein
MPRYHHNTRNFRSILPPLWLIATVLKGTRNQSVEGVQVDSYSSHQPAKCARALKEEAPRVKIGGFCWRAARGSIALACRIDRTGRLICARSTAILRLRLNRWVLSVAGDVGQSNLREAAGTRQVADLSVTSIASSPVGNGGDHAGILVQKCVLASGRGRFRAATDS